MELIYWKVAGVKTSHSPATINCYQPPMLYYNPLIWRRIFYDVLLLAPTIYFLLLMKGEQCYLRHCHIAEQIQTEDISLKVRCYKTNSEDFRWAVALQTVREPIIIVGCEHYCAVFDFLKYRDNLNMPIINRKEMAFVFNVVQPLSATRSLR